MADDSSGLDPGLYQPLANPQPQASPAAVVPALSPAPPNAEPDSDDLVAKLNAAVPSAGSGASGGGGDVDELVRQLNAATAGGGDGQPPGKQPPGAPPSPPHHQTQFQKAGTPAPPKHGAPPAPELTLAQTAQGAAQNFLPSLGQAAGSIWNSVTHPVQTVQNIAQLGTGLASQAAGALGAQQDPAAKAKAEAMAKALESHYANAYGSVKGFKQNVATDPVGVLMDASVFADPIAGALGKVADVGKLGALSDAAGVASKVLPYVNPVKSALAVARAPGALASKVLRGAGSVTSRVPSTALDLATQIGRDGDPVAQQAFTRFATGQGDATEIQQMAQQKLAQIRQQTSDQYLAGKAGLADVQPSFDPIDQAISDARSKIQMGGPEFQQAAGQFPEANAAVDNAEKTINAYRNSPDPLHGSLYGVDNLKQAIYDQADNYAPGSAANSALMGVYHGARQALVDADPAYASLMENFQAGKSNLNDLTKTLGLGPKAAATGTLIKSLRAMKTGTGQNLLDQLMEGNPELQGALAGSAINPWSQHGSVWEAALGAGLPGALVHPLAAAGIIPGALAGWAASSPRVIGSAANLMGQAGNKLDALGSPIAQAGAKGAYYAGRANEEQQSPTVPSQPSQPNAPTAPLKASPSDIDTATRMIIGEAGNQPDAGKLAALYTAINRARKSGKSLADVINEPNAYEAVTSGLTGNIDPNSPQFQYIRDNIVTPAISGKLADPTGGMTHFINKKLQLQDGRKIPSWAGGDGLQIGDHTFYSADGGRIPRASGGSVSDEHLIQALMKRAEKAKKAEDASTKPLLHVPDSVVAKALEVAGAAI